MNESTERAIIEFLFDIRDWQHLAARNEPPSEREILRHFQGVAGDLLDDIKSDLFCEHYKITSNKV